MKKFLYFSIIILLAFSACNLINPKEQVPTYIHIEPFIFDNPDSNITGSSSHDIPSAFVYIDDIAVGTFDLPCTAPVIMTKTGKLTIVPAVTNQGLKNYLFSYPYYTGDTSTLIFNPGKVQNTTPHTRYHSNMTSANFRMKINFEEGLPFKNLSGDTTIVLEKDPTLVFEGKNSGGIYIKAPQKSSESITQNYFEIPDYTVPCYLEIDYKSTIPFQIGIQGQDPTGAIYGEYLAGFYPKATWGKLYISLSTFLNTNKTYSRYFLKFRTSLEETNGKYTEGYVLIDNIKVISR